MVSSRYMTSRGITQPASSTLTTPPATSRTLEAKESAKSKMGWLKRCTSLSGPKERDASAPAAPHRTKSHRQAFRREKPLVSVR